MKKIVFILLTFFVSIFGEDIQKYDVYIKVHNDGKLSVRESIYYNFGSVPRHGIFREIPKKQNIFTNIKAFRDGKVEEFAISYPENTLKIKIGSANETISGVHKYDIYYDIDYVVSKFNSEKNAIVFNPIGTEWKIYIRDINIFIELPEKLLNSSIETFSGKYGSTNSNVKVEKISDLSYHLKLAYLPPKNGVTFRLSFDAELIEVTTPSVWWVFLFIFLFTVGIYFYWDKYGRDPKIGSISPQYYPPKDLDVLEAGLLLDQYANEEDISTGILYLASEGYLKIEVTGEGNDSVVSKIASTLFSTKKITLIKIDKPTLDLKHHMKLLYNSLFYDSDTFVVGQKSVKVASRLKTTIQNIDNSLYKWSENEEFMQQNPQTARVKFALLSTLFALPFIIFSVIASYKFIGDMIFFEMMMGFFLLIGTIAFFKAPTKVAKVMLFLFFMAFPLVSLIALSFNSTAPFPLILFVFVPIFFATRYMGAHTRKGIQKLRYLLGFRDFIEKVEKDRIKLFLNQDPNYLDKVLPYAVLFGVSEHWMEFYVDLDVDTPYWYSGNINSISHLDRDIRSGFSSTANYSESSSGSTSSGGFSGGGSGGGGGGSW